MKRNDNWTKERTLFRNVTSASPLMAWAADADGQCFYLSPAWCEFTGRSEQESLGFNWLTAVHTEDIAHVRKSFFLAIDSRTAYGIAYRLECADGQYHLVWDVGLPKFGDDEAFNGFFGTTCSIQNYQARDMLVASPALAPAKHLLSPREREVLKLISDGNTTDTVAAILGIGVRTVDSHVATAANKLGGSNRVHTVAKAMRLNEI